MQAEVEEAWRAKSVRLRRSRLADEGAVRQAEQRMQGAQQRAAQQQRERQQRDAALQVQALREEKHCLSWKCWCTEGQAICYTGPRHRKAQRPSTPTRRSYGCSSMHAGKGKRCNRTHRWICLLQAAAERERQKAQAAATAERAAFEAQEARMAAELEQRTQQERRLLEEAAQRARQAAEQRRRCSLV